MQQLAPNIFRFKFLWPNAFNAYYIHTPNGRGESIVVDASTRWDWLLMRKQLADRPVHAVVLTHAHPDHQGCAKKICTRFNAPLACHPLDKDSAEGTAPLVRQSPFLEILGNIVWACPRSRVSRTLSEGDTIAGFTIHHMPGHSPGHIILFRPTDRVAIVGDLINTNDYLNLRTILRESPRIFSLSPAQNRASMQKLLDLNPSLLLPGHGPPLKGTTRLAKLLHKLAS